MTQSRPSQPRMTVTRLAQLAGVSPTTVSHVLNGRTQTRVRPETRERILDLAKQHRYRPSLIARRLLLRRSGLIACVFPDITSSVGIRLAKGIEQRLRSADYNLVLCHSDYDLETEIRLVSSLAARGMDAILVGCVSHDDQHFQELQAQGYPLIRLDEQPERNIYDFVTYDDRVGIRAAVQHLVELGHRSIGYVTGVPNSPTDDDRLRGYEQGLRDAGIEPRPEWRLVAGFEKADGRRAAASLLAQKSPPTAVVAFNDHVAIGFMQVLREHGVRVPQDVSVVGFDDTELAADPAYDLTTLRLPEDVWAEKLVELALRRIDDGPSEEPTQQVLEPRLVVRSSTAPRRG